MGPSRRTSPGMSSAAGKMDCRRVITSMANSFQASDKGRERGTDPSRLSRIIYFQAKESNEEVPNFSFWDKMPWRPHRDPGAEPLSGQGEQRPEDSHSSDHVGLHR